MQLLVRSHTKLATAFFTVYFLALMRPTIFVDRPLTFVMDLREQLREEQDPGLPSEEMKKEFELWNEEYTINALTDLTSSQIDSKRLRFENKVHRLIAEHNPGRLIKENPILASSMGKPAYTADQWEQAKKTIQREAEKIQNRFDRAAGIVRKEERESQQAWYVKLIEAAVPDSVKLG